MAKTNIAKSDEIIRLEHISKHFGGVNALNDVSFSIAHAEIHAIVGENGAGKSTLMKLLAGVQPPDSGNIYINGQKTNISSPQVSEELGIAMVFQELNLFTPMTVASNIFIRRELKNGNVLLNEREMCNQAAKVLKEQLMVDIDPKTKIEKLTTGQRQIIEIARAIHRGTSVVIMDEPNSALNDQETKALFKIIRHLKDCGITVLYVSHRLEEVFTISDRISVLRDGHYMGTWETKKTTIDNIVTNVVGKRLGDIFPNRTSFKGEKKNVLSIKNLILGFNTKPIEFEVKKGEVLGLAGLEGSGVQNVFHAIFGLDEKTHGFKVYYDDKEVEKVIPQKMIEKGWALIPADRRNQGLMLEWSILKNASLVIIPRLINHFGLLKHGQERKIAKEYIEKFSIATDSIDKKVHNLSGGNQQKVVLAKWLATQPKLLILNDPTRGIDVGTKQEIYKLIFDWANQGYAILFTSSEIEEIMGVSDRIMVMYKGQIIREFDKKKTDKEEVMRYVLGGEGNMIESQFAGEMTSG